MGEQEPHLLDLLLDLPYKMKMTIAIIRSSLSFVR